MPRQKSNWYTCTKYKTLSVLNGIGLFIVVSFQGGILNYFIISDSNNSYAPYFWFLGDFGILGLGIYALFVAYTDLRKNNKENRKRDKLVDGIPVSSSSSTVAPTVDLTSDGHQLFAKGRFPLLYLTWLGYASLFVARLAVVYHNEIPNKLLPNAHWGPQLLKISIASVCLVFMLLVAGHHDAHRRSPRAQYIHSLCSSTAFELLDSIAFLGILNVRESKLILPYDLENSILTFALLNFFLPTIALYKLSLCDFGQENSVPLGSLYRLLHLLLVNVPYLVIRMYLWSGYGSDISIFVLKNVLGIVMHLADLFPDLVILYYQFHIYKLFTFHKEKDRNSHVNHMELNTL